MDEGEDHVTPWFDAQVFDAYRQEKNLRWGRPIRVSERTESTNDLALGAIASKAPNGALWVTREQERGRGRQGKTWKTNPGEALLLSVLLRYPGPAPHLSGFALGAGLALRSVVAAHLSGRPGSLPVTVKWPNDVLVGDRKVGGILVETRADNAGSFGLAVGVGLNVFTQAFPEELPDATSLALEGVSPEKLSLELLAAQLLFELEKRAALLLKGGFSPLVQEMNEFDYLAGKWIEVGDAKGIARGVGARGQLLIEQEDGSRSEVISGSVILRAR